MWILNVWQDSSCYWCLLFRQCFIPVLWSIQGFTELKLFFYAPLCRCWNGYTSWEQHCFFPPQPLHFWAGVSKLLLNCMWAMRRQLLTTLPISAWLYTLVTSLEPEMLLKGGLPVHSPPKRLLTPVIAPPEKLICWRPTGRSWGSSHVQAVPSRGLCCFCSAVDEAALLPQGWDLVWVMWDDTFHCHMWCTSTPPLSKGEQLSPSGILSWRSPPRELLTAKSCLAMNFKAPSARTHNRGSLGQSRKMPGE